LRQPIFYNSLKNHIMKSTIFTLFLALVLSSCKSISSKQELPCNFKEIITKVSNQKPQTPRASIKEYLYNGEKVYFIQTENYPDGMSKIINSNCKTICVFGGIAGFNSCKDFDKQAKFVKTIWKDNR